MARAGGNSLGKTIETGELANLSVTTAKLAALAVTLAKLAANSVDASKIIDGVVTNVKLAGSIALSKLLTPPEANATADQTDVEIKTAFTNQIPGVSQALAEAGTSTSVKQWSPERVKQAIVALASGVTVSSQVDSLTADETTTSASYVSTALSITLANRSGGQAIIICGSMLSVNNPASLMEVKLFDDGTGITRADGDMQKDVANDRGEVTLNHAMSLNGSVINLRIATSSGGQITKIHGSAVSHSYMSVLEVS